MRGDPVTAPSLTLVRRIKAPPEKVFAAFTQPQHILHWWGPDAGPTLHAECDLRVGGRFRVVFETLDGTRYENQGEYLEIEPAARLVMRWCWSATPHLRSRVTVVLRAIDIGTELVLVHDQFVDEATRDQHRWGWNGTLEKLERWLMVGSDSLP